MVIEFDADEIRLVERALQEIQPKLQTRGRSADASTAIKVLEKIVDAKGSTARQGVDGKSKSKVKAPAVPAVDWGQTEPKKKRKAEAAPGPGPTDKPGKPQRKSK